MKSLEIFEFDGIGYKKLFDTQNWRVAMLNYIKELEIEHIDYVEAHDMTDEVFVLLEGECIMFIAKIYQEKIESFEGYKLEKHKVYKINKSVFHAHVLSRDAKLLIVEQEDTNDQNSRKIYLSKQDKEKIGALYKEI